MFNIKGITKALVLFLVLTAVIYSALRIKTESDYISDDYAFSDKNKALVKSWPMGNDQKLFLFNYNGKNKGAATRKPHFIAIGKDFAKTDTANAFFESSYITSITQSNRQFKVILSINDYVLKPSTPPNFIEIIIDTIPPYSDGLN